MNILKALRILLLAQAMLQLVRGVRPFELHVVFQSILKAYDEIVGTALAPLGEIIAVALAKWGIEFSLYEHWRHLFVLFCVYFFSHSASALQVRFWSGFFWYAIWGFVCALFFSVLAGSIALSTVYGAGLVILITALAFSVFTFGNSVRASLFFRPDGEGIWRALAPALRHPRRFLYVGLFLVVAVGAVSFSGVSENNAVNAMIALFAFLLYLAVYRIVVNQNWGRYDEKATGSKIHQMFKTREAYIGWSILNAMFLVVAELGISQILPA